MQTEPDVLFGGGKKYFDQTVQSGEFQGQTVLDQAKKSGYEVVTDAAGLNSAVAGKPLLGRARPALTNRRSRKPVRATTG